MNDVMRPVMPRYESYFMQMTMAQTPKIAMLSTYSPMKTEKE